MITNSFIIIPGIGEKTEMNLWRKGILTWDDLKVKSHTIGLRKTQKGIVQDYLEKAIRALYRHDGSFFANQLPQKEYWRLYKEFLDKTLFLDIETTGLSQYYDKITIIGTFDGHKVNIFVRGNNLAEFPHYLQDYQVIVTFNGKLFDMPFIRKEFPQIQLPPVHIDLRYLLRGLGFMGSLKKIEEKLGIMRPPQLKQIGGREAAVLWSRFTRGDNEAFERLLLYNIHDTVNLQRILHFCYRKKTEVIRSIIHSCAYQPKLGESLRDKKIDHSLPVFNFDIPRVTVHSLGNGLLEVWLDNETFRIRHDRIKKPVIKIDALVRRVESRGFASVSVGIDLSSSEKRASGVCRLRGREAYLDLAKTDEEIVAKVEEVKPAIVSIDSPLSLPIGRCCGNNSCQCRIHGITRECERILKKRGINVYPCLIQSMQKLTMRGIRLATLLKRRGYEVIESYPGAAQDILGLPRRKVDLKELETDLINMGLRLISNRRTIIHDEIDALTSALVGYFYLAGEYEAIGNIDEGYLIVPAVEDEGKLVESGGL